MDDQITIPENFGAQTEKSKRLHDEWRAETDWRLKMLRHPDMGLSMQRVINASVVGKSGEAVAEWLRNEMFPDPALSQAMQQDAHAQRKGEAR